MAIATVLGISSPAEAVIFAFESFIDGGEYSGMLEFAGEGSGLSPLFTSNSVLNVFRNSPDGTAYASAGTNIGLSPFANAPTFDVTSTTLDVVSNGGMTFDSGNQIDFLDASPDRLGDPEFRFIVFRLFRPGSGFAEEAVTFTPVNSTTSVPFEFSPTLGLLAVGSVWGVSRLRKKA